ncbi:hypothetical protein T484DRAFT_1760953, partial [Baffinella frigidus]
AFVPFFIGGLTILAIGPATRILVDEICQQLRRNTGADRRTLAQLQICQQLRRNAGADRRTLAQLQAVFYPDRLATASLAVFYPDRLATASFVGTRRGQWLQLVAVVLFPLCVGLAAGGRALVGFLSGSVVTATFLAMTASVVGNLAARAKTVVEVGEMFGGSGSETHSACVTVSLFAGPLRDCFAPVVIAGARQMCLVGFLIAPLLSSDVQSLWFKECVVARTQQGESISSCYDWGRAYWVAIPLVVLVIFLTFSYFVFWRSVLRSHIEDPEPHPLPNLGGQGAGVSMVPVAPEAPAKVQPPHEIVYREMAPLQPSYSMQQPPSSYFVSAPPAPNPPMNIAQGSLGFFRSTVPLQPSFEPSMRQPSFEPSMPLQPSFEPSIQNRGGTVASVDDFVMSGYSVQMGGAPPGGGGGTMDSRRSVGSYGGATLVSRSVGDSMTQV